VKEIYEITMVVETKRSEDSVFDKARRMLVKSGMTPMTLNVCRMIKEVVPAREVTRADSHSLFTEFDKQAKRKGRG
jgi:hypothetical protein